MTVHSRCSRFAMFLAMVTVLLAVAMPRASAQGNDAEIIGAVTDSSAASRVHCHDCMPSETNAKDANPKRGPEATPVVVPYTATYLYCQYINFE